MARYNYRFKKLAATLPILLLPLLSQPALAKSDVEVFEGKVNKALWDFSKQYEKPRLIKVGERVHTSYAYDHANYAFIEGDDGVIMIDSGWYPGLTKKSLDDYRKITGKPVIAVIYTHIHPDHVGGLPGVIGDIKSDVPIYAPEGWDVWLNKSFSTLRPSIYKRFFYQAGLLLQHGPDGTVGLGDGMTPVPSGVPGFVPPTVSISEKTEMIISGVRIQLIPSQGDLNEALFVWLPDDKVLFAGDILAGTFPYIETLRFDMERDPRKFIASFKQALALKPDYLVAGHGRLLMGADDVKENLSANRDAAEFMVDQVDRLYNKGYTADQIIDELKLPPALAANPDLQFHYHRLEWIIKSMHIKRTGFFGEIMDISTLTQSQEALRWIKILGGEDKVVAAANDALAADDPRWAAKLATYVLAVNKGNKPAFELRLKAYRRIAAITASANERNYLLTEIKHERGELDWKSLLAPGAYKAVKFVDADAALTMLKARFKAEDADGLELSVELKVSDLTSPRYLVVRNNVLFIRKDISGKSDASIEMNRITLNKIVANLTTYREALDNKDIAIISGKKAAQTLANLIE